MTTRFAPNLTTLNWFNSLDEVNDLLGHWYKSHDFDRPHSSLKYKTPAAFENLNQNLYFRVAPVNEGYFNRSNPEDMGRLVNLLRRRWGGGKDETIRRAIEKVEETLGKEGMTLERSVE